MERKTRKLANKLHNWYLDATCRVHHTNFNEKAQKPYGKLNKEQKFIDFYIARKVNMLLTKAYRNGFDEGWSECHSRRCK